MAGIPQRGWVALLAVVVVGGALGLFLFEPGTAEPDPVHFDDTVDTGVVLETEYDDRDIDIPKAQVFYSQYEYVVGYRGVERFVDATQQPGHDDRFGYPLAVYVSDYSEVEFELTGSGYPVAEGTVGWTDAETATFVVGSEARTPAGETVMAFSDRADAETFAADYGGDVTTWETVLETDFDVDDATAVQGQVDDRHELADEHVANARTLHERPVEVVVGEDADSITEAVDIAPANSTIVVPEGTYEEHVTVDRPVTITGEGTATIEGDGSGTVVYVDDERAAITDLEITGVGESFFDEDDESDDALEMAYGSGDAGIEVNGTSNALIENVTIETPSNGVLLRDTPETVVRNVTVYGADHWSDGYMGVLTMRTEDNVVENSRFVDGRDGLYTHRSNGLVYRNNELENNRIGIHLMYTSGVVLADNTVTDAASSGIDIMTDPEHNAVVGNEVTGASEGLLTAGSDSYVADNVLTDNDVGMTTGAENSRYEGNVIAGNVEGVQANQLLPTSQVVDNDFVDNHNHANARLGVLRIWTEDGSGNYWDGAVGSTDGDVLDRAFTPTHPVDQRVHRVDATPTLARAPVVDALGGLDGTVSGMRDGQIVDTHPHCEPANPELLETTDWEATADDCSAYLPSESAR
ncbi:NosD domain-containing protein [Natrarchaeobaculum sulfurireducens]|uniref:NosD domain-containing protein n=1 Tax=Natrarchaeobaculum sulfurireducens TaxID=2044521 RepID=UPI000E3C6480|nr:NosD domain-containing protein [Natrarchaeobaculum sulfurireducens]